MIAITDTTDIARIIRALEMLHAQQDSSAGEAHAVADLLKRFSAADDDDNNQSECSTEPEDTGLFARTSEHDHPWSTAAVRFSGPPNEAGAATPFDDDPPDNEDAPGGAPLRRRRRHDIDTSERKDRRAPR